MRSFILLFSFATIVRAAFSPTHVPLNVSSIELLGIETDDANNQVINHDGGGGGSQAGYHVQIFADSYTTGSFVHNSMAYIGYVGALLRQVYLRLRHDLERNASDPTDMYTFGMGGTAGSKNFKAPFVGPIPNSNESALGPYFAIWAYTGLAALPDNKTLVGVFPAINESNTNFATFYSTMVTIDVVDPTNITSGGYPGSKRITPQLFYASDCHLSEVLRLLMQRHAAGGGELRLVRLARERWLPPPRRCGRHGLQVGARSPDGRKDRRPQPCGPSADPTHGLLR
jgi:hypothetical protein